jgi:hypothetical protein
VDDSNKRNGRIVVSLTNDPVIDAGRLNDALIESDINLFSVEGSPRLLRDGTAVPVNRDILVAVISEITATKRFVVRDGKYAVLYEPLVPSDRIIRAMMHGNLPARGETEPRRVPGGSLIDRLPRVCG